LLGKRDFTKAQQRYIRCRLNKKIKEFVSNELTILQDNGYLVGTIAASSNVAASCNAYADKTSKNGTNHAQINAPRVVHAPWSGGEQCKQDPCRKAFGITLLLLKRSMCHL
jgi:hypothetical protein